MTRGLTRQALLESHIGKEYIRSAARQATLLELQSLRSSPRINYDENTSEAAEKTPNRKTTSTTINRVAKKKSTMVVKNPCLQRYAHSLDRLSVGPLPSNYGEDLVIYSLDDSNAVGFLKAIALQFAVIRGRLLIYPRQYLAEKNKCPSLGQQKCMFYNPRKRLWSHGCAVAFDVLQKQITTNSNCTKLTASIGDIKKQLAHHGSENINHRHRLTITDVFDFMVK